MTDRGERRKAFLDKAGWGQARLELLADDASFRCYYRLTRGSERRVLMDAPPPNERVHDFVHVARLLIDLGLSAPRLEAVDEEAGFILLEDFGDRTFTRALLEGVSERALYEAATDTLVALQEAVAGRLAGLELPPYDERRLLGEALLLPDWTLPALRGQSTPAALRESYSAAWREALRPLAETPPTLVLRDYHVDNLMLLEGRQGARACGLLDFQDAVIGSPFYDLVSLLQDARRDVSPEVVEAMLARYQAARPPRDPACLLRDYSLLGAQRNAKIIGIFTRLDRRDGKPRYLGHIPRVWRLLEADLEHPALAPVKAWFDREMPHEERVAPPARAAA